MSVYFYILNCSWNYKPSGVCKRGFSVYILSEGKSWPNSVASNYLYLFEWANLCILFIPPFSNRAETELKCKTGFTETIYNWHFIICGQLVLSPF